MPEQPNLVDLPNSAKEKVAGATRLGDANPGEKVLVSVIVRRRSGEGFALTARAAGADRAAWRREQRARFAATDGADQADVDAVAGWAAQLGLDVQVADSARRTVTIEGTVAQVSDAFGVSLGRYETDGHEYRGREGVVRVPRDLAGIIDAVLGLDNRPQARPHFQIGPPIAEADLPHPTTGLADVIQDQAAAPVSPAPVSPAPVSPAPGSPASGPQPLWATQVAKAYDFPTDVNGSGEAIAIIELGGGFTSADVDGYFTKAGIATPNVIAVPVDSGSNTPGGAADGEVLLDIEVSGSIAPGATIVVYFADSSDRGFVDAISQAAHDTVHAPSVISISWGGPEDQWTTQARQSFEAALSDAAKLGVTVLCAAGDHGAGDGANDNHAHVDYPASSPNIVACGGTTLTIGADGSPSEAAWNDQNGWATGGGISEVFPVPSWQTVTMPPNVNGGGPGRGVPDVCGNADINSGYYVLVDGQWNPVGGTSAVAPLYAGLTACLNQAQAKPVGALCPTLYSSALAGAFHDVLTGDNTVPQSQYGPAVTGYNAGPGWDACTGLGSINGTALRTALSPTPTPTPAP
ncbi:MAG TPA: protease pro-enzyme activation domain-containing protein [Streptosporangiaceae bacterium]|jgi:kumamolisin|nr:protease pro-enzyme activation domain-containing protein [Streptosporangiaceae bacterium]